MIILSVLAFLVSSIRATPCVWQSPEGLTYDLRPLTRIGEQKSYYILDGDLACTVEEEPSFSYTWNFCTIVTDESLPGACVNEGKNGVALQYLESGKDSFCFIIGRFDGSHPDMSILDASDPSKGVRLEYPSGESCTNGDFRRTLIDVKCVNAGTKVLHAVSDQPCQYRVTMESIYGCPKQCASTSNGMCDNHGHCGFDHMLKASYCYCNEGHYGDACENHTDLDKQSTWTAHSMQIGFILTLIVVTLFLVWVVVSMKAKIQVPRSDLLTQLSLDSTH